MSKMASLGFSDPQIEIYVHWCCWQTSIDPLARPVRHDRWGYKYLSSPLQSFSELCGSAWVQREEVRWKDLTYFAYWIILDEFGSLSSVVVFHLWSAEGTKTLQNWSASVTSCLFAWTNGPWWTPSRWTRQRLTSPASKGGSQAERKELLGRGWIKLYMMNIDK